VSGDFNLRSRGYQRRLVWGVFAGLLSGVGAFIFIGLMNLGIGLVWPNPPSWEPFSGSWTIVVIMTLAGFLVGLIHHFTSAAELDVFEAVNKGRLDPRPVPASLLASLISLIGGFSLGPEVPTGMLASGFGTWLSDRRKMDEETTRSNVLSSVSAAYAGLFSSPFAILVMLLESAHMQTAAYYGTLLIAGLAAAVGFSLFYWIGGDTFSSLLGLVQPPEYSLRVWDIGLGVIFGIIALPVAILFLLLFKLLSRLVAPLNNWPIIRSTLGGVLLGLLGMALPITLFLGTDGLVTTTQQAAEIGVGLLILFALAKLLALGGALSFGFIGGPIFPLLFVGATLGSAINLVFPQIPLGLAVGCLIVAVPAAIVPIPLALAVIGIVIVGLSPTNAIPVILASLTSYSLAHGLGLFSGDANSQR
jgi:H+/Cl- antiporter ClcA